MSTFIIELASQSNGYIFNKDRFLTYFPDSNISNDVRRGIPIRIMSPDVRPAFIRFLWNLLENGKVPSYDPGMASYLNKMAGHFNMKLLYVISDPHWRDFLRSNLGVNILNSEHRKLYDKQTFQYASQNSYLPMLEYLSTISN